MKSRVHFDLSKEMKSPQIHHFDTSKELWSPQIHHLFIWNYSKCLGLCTFKPTTCPFILGLQIPHLSFLISQRRWRALKSTIWSLKGDEEPSNPPFWYLQGAVEPSNPPPVHLKLFQVLGFMYLQTHDMSIYLGSSNPISPFFTSQRRWRALSTSCPFISKGDEEPSNPTIFLQSKSFDLSKEMKSPQIHHFDTSKEL